MSTYIIDSCGKTTFTTTPSTIVLRGELVVITLPTTPIAVKNRDIIRFNVNECIKALGATTERVILNIDNTVVSVYDKNGNYLRADQLKRNNLYYVQISTEPTGAIMLTNLPRSLYVVTTTIEPTTTKTRTRKAKVNDETTTTKE